MLRSSCSNHCHWFYFSVESQIALRRMHIPDVHGYKHGTEWNVRLSSACSNRASPVVRMCVNIVGLPTFLRRDQAFASILEGTFRERGMLTPATPKVHRHQYRRKVYPYLTCPVVICFPLCIVSRIDPLGYSDLCAAVLECSPTLFGGGRYIVIGTGFLASWSYIPILYYH